jgi:hypothetical protein
MERSCCTQLLDWSTEGSKQSKELALEYERTCSLAMLLAEGTLLFSASI